MMDNASFNRLRELRRLVSRMFVSWNRISELLRAG